MTKSRCHLQLRNPLLGEPTVFDSVIVKPALGMRFNRGAFPTPGGLVHSANKGETLRPVHYIPRLK